MSTTTNDVAGTLEGIDAQGLKRLSAQYAPGSADRQALDEALRRLDAGEDPRAAPRDARTRQDIR